MLNRFVKGEETFIPSRLSDNPSLDQESYRKTLSKLGSVDRARLLDGDWDIVESGELFKMEWFKIVDDYPRDANAVRYWDFAATEKTETNDPDHTAGVHICEQEGQYWIIDVRAFQKSPNSTKRIVQIVAENDGKELPIWIEQEGGSSGKTIIDVWKRDWLKGYSVHGDRATGEKRGRMKPLSAALENGNVFLVRGAWNKAYIEELTRITSKTSHDDRADATAGGMDKLTSKRGAVFIG